MSRSTHVGATVAFLTLLGLLLMPGRAQAQFQLGVGGGLTFATLEVDEDEVDFNEDDIGTRTGFNAGAWVGIPVSEIISIVPGAFYVQKGATLDGDPSVDATLALDYIEVPVLLSVLATGRDRPVALSFFLGPAVAFEVGCALDVEVDGVDNESVDCGDGDEQLDIETKSVDFGAMFGAGLSFPVARNTSVWVNGGLDLGLTNIDDSETDQDDVKNSAFFVDIGLSWMIGG